MNKKNEHTALENKRICQQLWLTMVRLNFVQGIQDILNQQLFSMQVLQDMTCKFAPINMYFFFTFETDETYIFAHRNWDKQHTHTHTHTHTQSNKNNSDIAVIWIIVRLSLEMM